MYVDERPYVFNDKFTFNSSASFSLLHSISGPLALVAVASAVHKFLHVFSPSSSHFMTRPGDWERRGAMLTSGVGVENPPQEQLPLGPSVTPGLEL